MTRDRRLLLLAAALLAAVTFWSFREAAGNGFVGYDDPGYLTKNPVVRRGLSLSGAAWAFTTTHQANWHPLTWLSHMLDVSLFGLDPGAHHLVSLAIHVASSLLLLLALWRLTGALWPSALVAALFALHPLHVESVAWAAERKDVLSTLLALAALLAYVRAARRGTVARSVAVPALFALALLAKPMPLTLPLLLLVLDWWPLGRWAAGGRRSLWVEKTPLFLLTAASAGITLFAQARGGAVVPVEHLSLPARLTHALTGYARYLGATLWPVDLVVFRPLPSGAAPAWAWTGALLLLLALTTLAWRLRRSQPWFGAGWLWYLVSLVPVIGLVQVGAQGMADRYTYLPLTGIFVAAAWSLARVASLRPRLRPALAVASVCAVAACAALTGRQVPLWRDDLALFSHAARTANPSWVALAALGEASARAGDHAAALGYFERALSQQPNSPNLLNAVGNVLNSLGRGEEAEAWYRNAILAAPKSPVAHYNLAKLLMTTERSAEAERHLAETIRLNPLFLPAHTDLGLVLAADGRFAEAAEAFRRALELDPSVPDGRFNLALALAGGGDDAAAVGEYRRAIAEHPGDAGAYARLGQSLTRLGRTGEAAAAFRRAIALDPAEPVAREGLRTLGEHAR